MSDFQHHVESAKAGDEAAFVVLFRAAQPALLRFLQGVCRDSVVAEDVAAETWVSVVKGLHRFEGDEPGWRAWVLTIGRARLRDAQRKLFAQGQAGQVDEQVLLSRPAPDDVHGSVEELISTEAVLGLVRLLPREQAEVVLLRHVVGLDVARTAEVVGRSPGAVRVSVHRGLRRLAELLAASAPEALHSDEV